MNRKHSLSTLVQHCGEISTHWFTGKVFQVWLCQSFLNSLELWDNKYKRTLQTMEAFTRSNIRTTYISVYSINTTASGTTLNESHEPTGAHS